MKMYSKGEKLSTHTHTHTYIPVLNSQWPDYLKRERVGEGKGGRNICITPPSWSVVGERDGEPLQIVDLLCERGWCLYMHEATWELHGSTVPLWSSISIFLWCFSVAPLNLGWSICILAKRVFWLTNRSRGDLWGLMMTSTSADILPTYLPYLPTYY